MFWLRLLCPKVVDWLVMTQLCETVSRLFDLLSLKYILSVSLPKKFAHPWSRVQSESWGVIYKKWLILTKLQRVCELNANLLINMFFSSVYRRLIEQSTSYLRIKVPEESKLVSWRFIGSRGYKSEQKLLEELIKHHYPIADYLSVFRYFLSRDIKHCSFIYAFLISTAKFGLFNQPFLC